DDGDARGCCFGRQHRRRTSGRNDHSDLMANQLGRQPGQPIHLILGPAIFDRHALALYIASILEALAEWAEKILTGVRRSLVKEPDHGQCRLLCPRRKRPRGRRAAEERDEIAPSWVEHGLLPGTRCASLPQAQDAPEAPAGPWGRPESF